MLDLGKAKRQSLALIILI